MTEEEKKILDLELDVKIQTKWVNVYKNRLEKKIDDYNELEKKYKDLNSRYESLYKFAEELVKTVERQDKQTDELVKINNELVEVNRKLQKNVGKVTIYESLYQILSQE